MRIKVTHDIDDFASDLARIPSMVVRDMRAVVRQATITGNTVARDNARRSAGAHGKLYPRSFTWETRASLFGGASFTGEYGPDVSRPQGGMSFEFGSRNQPPHLDLARSADLIGPAFAQEVRGAMDDWFWAS